MNNRSPNLSILCWIDERRFGDYGEDLGNFRMQLGAEAGALRLLPDLRLEGIKDQAFVNIRRCGYNGSNHNDTVVRNALREYTMNDEESRTPMWTLQWVFQRVISKVAEETFNHLDEKLHPRFFIIGIPHDDKLAVSLEPPEESGYNPELFGSIVGLAREIEAAEVAKSAWMTQSRETKQPTISGRSVQMAIERTLNDPKNPSKYVSYCSEPTMVGDYDVCCVLQFEETAFRDHFSVPIEWRGNARLPGSLIDATAVEFLQVCRTVLSGPRKTLDLMNPLGHQPEDILRMGGREFMSTANHIGAGTTFDDINKLSWKTHEGELAGGEIYFIHWDNYHLDMPVEFKHPAELSNTEAARKLIEMAGAKKLSQGAGSKLHLVSHGHAIDGIGGLKELEDEYDRYNSHVFIVRFRGYYKWELWDQDGGIMMQVISGVPSLPRELISKEKFKDHVRRTFTQSSPDEDALWNIVDTAVQQKHGTMIVISSAAAEEADRLEEQSTVLREPVKLVDDLLDETLLMLTSIDGALLVDPSGTCYAAGVILDGNAVKGKGTSSRGARYNSAIRYVYGARNDGDRGECLAVVVSKDGGINMVRELHHRIYRSEITKHVERLRASVAAETVNPKEYYKAIFWLSDHRFYLSQELCDELNKIKEATRLRLNAQEGSSTTPADFMPDEEMGDSYFIEEVNS